MRMDRDQVGTVVIAAVVLIALVVTTGCAASRRTQGRVNVLTAENVDLRQQSVAAQQQARDAQLAQDRALVELQSEKHRAGQLDQQLGTAEQRAMQGDQALAQLQRAREDQARNAERLAAIAAEVDRVNRMRAEVKPAVTAPPDMGYRPSPHLDAFAADLRGKLRAASIDLPVEMRTTRGGERRVAEVLANAFPAGTDSLADNMDAVRAVVGLGQLIARSYPGSLVSVEGHTDSDPIKASRWRSNEHLAEARAQTVKALLVKAGVQGNLIQTIGAGASNPLEAGTTARAKAQNRRVEIYISPST